MTVRLRLLPTKLPYLAPTIPPTTGSLLVRASKLAPPSIGNEPDIVGVALRLDMLIIDIAEPGRGLGLGLGGATLDISDSPSVSVPPSDIIPAPPSTSAYIRGFTASYVMY